MTTVAVGSLGGTITMTSRSGGKGVAPTLRGEDLIAAVPDLRSLADVHATTLQSVPGASLTRDQLLSALQWAREAVDHGASGVVLVQGTDTLEESAFLLDLFWDRPQPLVLTGAMRPPQRPGADGPGNLLAAVATAAAPAATDLGALVVLNDEVHAAARVRKTDTTALGAFSAPGSGPLGRVVEGTVDILSAPFRTRALPQPRGAAARVALVESTLDDDAELVRLVVGAGFDGLVVGGFGVGHVSGVAAEVLTDVLARIPVVVASRTGGGPTLRTTYGFSGSESDLLQRGVVMAGWLDPRKARLLLWSLLALGHDRRQIAAEFELRGRPPSWTNPKIGSAP